MLRRYPVKSMGGEALSHAEFDERGVRGDRWYAVADEQGRLASGKDTRRFRRRDAVFDYTAATTPAGEVHVTGPNGDWRVGDPALDAELRAAMNASVRVAAETAVRHHDSGSVSIVGSASLRWCADRWGGDPDPRRLRPNIVFDADEPFVEESWAGRRIRLGTAVLEVVQRVPRCRMIDIDQDGAAPGEPWLTTLARERETCLAMYCDVVQPGAVRVGDPIVVAP